jgi:hypothetical protein
VVAWEGPAARGTAWSVERYKAPRPPVRHCASMYVSRGMGPWMT